MGLPNPKPRIYAHLTDCADRHMNLNYRQCYVALRTLPSKCVCFRALYF